MNMRFSFLVSLGLFIAVQPALAGTLGIGDAAPALSATKWVKGGPVDLAALKGKGIAVVEFWATWCAPCVASIPDLTELQHTYKNKDVTVIGFTKHDDDNTLETVEEFVGKRGDKVGYTIAFEKESKTSDAYMKASGQMGIPTAFVIDRLGRIAWIGHPMDGLEDVIEEIVAGKYDIEVAKKIAAIQKRLWSPENIGNTQETLKALDEWIALKPGDPTPHMQKFHVYAGELDKPREARAEAVKAVKAAAHKPRKLAEIAQELVGADYEHAYDGLAVRAINQAFEKAPNKTEVMIARFEVLAATGKEAEAFTWAEQVVEKLKGDPTALGRFAKAIAAPERTQRCNDLALRTVELAIAVEPENAAHLQAKFHIQAVCQKNAKAAEATGRYLIEKAADDAGLLNGFAWTLLTDEATKDKFNDLALAAAERCDKISESKNWMYLDTYALAAFETGARETAIKLQKKAIELCDNANAIGELEGRLKEFENGKTKEG